MMVLSTLSLQPYNEVLCWFISPFNEIAIGLIFARVGRLGGKCKVIYLFLKLNFSSVVLFTGSFLGKSCVTLTCSQTRLQICQYQRFNLCQGFFFSTLKKYSISFDFGRLLFFFKGANFTTYVFSTISNCLTLVWWKIPWNAKSENEFNSCRTDASCRFSVMRFVAARLVKDDRSQKG